MRSILTKDAFEDVFRRIDTLENTMKPQWGKMNTSQMLAHCQEPLKIALGVTEEVKEPLIKKMIMSLFKKKLYDDSEWKRNLPTTDQFRITDERDFKEEKEKLISLISAFYNSKDQRKWPKHPVFGKLTKEQWGKMQYKHLNHHLSQFGV